MNNESMNKSNEHAAVNNEHNKNNQRTHKTAYQNHVYDPLSNLSFTYQIFLYKTSMIVMGQRYESNNIFLSGQSKSRKAKF